MMQNYNELITMATGFLELMDKAIRLDDQRDRESQEKDAAKNVLINAYTLYEQGKISKSAFLKICEVVATSHNETIEAMAKYLTRNQ